MQYSEIEKFVNQVAEGELPLIHLRAVADAAMRKMFDIGGIEDFRALVSLCHSLERALVDREVKSLAQSKLGEEGIGPFKLGHSYYLGSGEAGDWKADAYEFLHVTIGRDVNNTMQDCSIRLTFKTYSKYDPDIKSLSLNEAIEAFFPLKVATNAEAPVD